MSDIELKKIRKLLSKNIDNVAFSYAAKKYGLYGMVGALNEEGMAAYKGYLRGYFNGRRYQISKYKEERTKCATS